MQKKKLLTAFVLIASGIGFSACSAPAKTPVSENVQQLQQQTVSPSDQPSTSPDGQRMQIPDGSTPIIGKITSIKDDRITIESMQPGADATPSSKMITIMLDSSTQYTGGTKDDLKTDAQIAGYGTENEDGSVTAQMIVLNIQERMGTLPSGAPKNPPAGNRMPQR